MITKKLGRLVFRIWPRWTYDRPLRLPHCLVKYWPWDGIQIPWFNYRLFYGNPTVNIGKLSITLMNER